MASDSEAEAGRLGGVTPDVIAYLQQVCERKNTSLARALHDDLGGHLVSAVMDVGWVEQHVLLPIELQQRLSRVRQALAAAIDLKRNMIEELRPSLLDNFGLFAAYRWHVKHTCQRAAVTCTEHYPATEPNFKPEASTGLFRIMQEIVELMVAEADVTALAVSMVVEGRSLVLQVKHEHRDVESIDMFEHAPAAMRAMEHRVDLLHGCLSVHRQPRATALSVQFPLEAVSSD